MENNTKMVDFSIDLVYLWVDGNDPQWRAKHNAFVGKTETKSSVNCEGRYADHDELKYSLRSAEMYAPWIRKIFIVTDNQIPSWFDISNPKIRVVDHTEILPTECLPCFSSRPIEHSLYKISGLAEHFLYANDDMYFNLPLSPSDFFDADGNPIVYVKHKTYLKNEISDANYPKASASKHVYGKALLLTRRRIWEKLGKNYPIIPCHNIEPFRKSNCLDTINAFKEDFEKMLPNKFRGEYDIEKLIFHLYDFYKGRNTLLHYADAGKNIVLNDKIIPKMTPNINTRIVIILLLSHFSLYAHICRKTESDVKIDLW